MKKKRLNLERKLQLSKDVISALATGQQAGIAGGGATQGDVTCGLTCTCPTVGGNPCPNTMACPTAIGCPSDRICPATVAATNCQGTSVSVPECCAANTVACG